MQGEAGVRLDIDGGDQVDPTLGGPCEDDGQCDDKVDCTVDHCDTTIGRCRFEPDDARCADPSYCNGAEKCDVRGGCMAGEVVACSDNSTCTIDTCVEETQSCRHEPRDADGDGDPTRNCGGQDCDDTNPLVSGKTSEVCGNKRDDDCDGEIDEADCASPEHDSCATALMIDEQGYYDVDLTATKLDYPSDCATEDDGFRDSVLQVTLPDGGPWDLDVTGKLDSGALALATSESCGSLKDQTCQKAFLAPAGGSASRLILRGVPAGAYPIYVQSDTEASVQVNVRWRAAEPKLGEYCEDAIPLEASGPPVLVRLPGYSLDTSSLCQPDTGDAFVAFTLEEAADITLVAEAKNELGVPVIALLDDTCRREMTCRNSQPGRLFVRDLAPGHYRVLVAGSGLDDISVRLDAAPVTPTPPGEGCDNAPPLSVGVEELVDLSVHEDAVFPHCLVGAPDATFEFGLEAKRDVMLVGRFSSGDTGSLSISSSPCTANRACEAGGPVLRAVKYSLEPGDYRGIIESARGNPVALSWFTRPPVAPLHVPFADDCRGVVTIPEQGGRFTGNTNNSFPDFSAGCDVGGQSEGGAPDQILKLTLTAPRRVILDMRGSNYATMLSVRRGPDCPGEELQLACATGYYDPRSFLDLDLQAGDYFVQIDGYDGASGAWKLDVFTAEPSPGSTRQ